MEENDRPCVHPSDRLRSDQARQELYCQSCGKLWTFPEAIAEGLLLPDPAHPLEAEDPDEEIDTDPMGRASTLPGIPGGTKKEPKAGKTYAGTIDCLIFAKRRFRCPKGHEHEALQPMMLYLSDKPEHHSDPICLECVIEYINKHFSCKEITDDPGEEG